MPAAAWPGIVRRYPYVPFVLNVIVPATPRRSWSTAPPRTSRAIGAQVGDTVELAVSQSDTIVTVSVIDLMHKFNATSNGAGSGTGEAILAVDFPAVSGGTTLGVPSFGTLVFSSALTNGYPLSSSDKQLQTDGLYSSSTLQIKTTASASKEAFTTVFAHSWRRNRRRTPPTPGAINSVLCGRGRHGEGRRDRAVLSS
jgi:hypothetical protein